MRVILKHKIQNLRLTKDLIIIIFGSTLTILLLSHFLLSSYIDRKNKRNYINQLTAKIENGRTSYPSSIPPVQIENFMRSLQHALFAEDENVERNEGSESLPYILVLWSEEGDILWHRNKQIQKLVKSDYYGKNDLKLYGESFSTNKEMLGKKEFNVSFKYNKLLDTDSAEIFYHLNPGHENGQYLHVILPYHSIKGLYIFIFVFSLFLALLITLSAYYIFNTILVPVKALRASVHYFIENGIPEPVYYQSENEIGKLVKGYNKLIVHLEKIRIDEKKVEYDSKGKVKFHDTDDNNLNVITYLQQKLFYQAVSRMEHYEISLFPRNPDYNIRNFFTATQSKDALTLLSIHFDVNNIEAVINKRIIQEQFTLGSHLNGDFSKTLGYIWNHLFKLSNLGPGIFMMSYDPDSLLLQYFRSGPFCLYVIEKSGDVNIFDTGEDYFLDHYKEPIEVVLNDPAAFIVVSSELFEILNHTHEDFKTEVISKVTGFESSKKMLTELLREVSELEPTLYNDFPSIISVIRVR